MWPGEWVHPKGKEAGQIIAPEGAGCGPGGRGVTTGRFGGVADDVDAEGLMWDWWWCGHGAGGVGVGVVMV